MTLHPRPSENTVLIAVPLQPTGLGVVEIEALWAEPLTPGRYAIRSIPFDVEGVHLYDVIEAHGGTPRSLKPEQCPVLTRVIKRSGHSTFHLTVGVGVPSREFERFWPRLASLGCTFEQRDGHTIAVDIPPTAEVSRIDRVLGDGEQEGVWELEEPQDEHPIAS